MKNNMEPPAESPPVMVAEMALAAAAVVADVNGAPRMMVVDTTSAAEAEVANI